MQQVQGKNNNAIFFLIVSLSFLFFQAYFRKGLQGFNDTFDMIKFMALAINLLLLPDFLEEKFTKWVSKLPTLLVIIVLYAILGFLTQWITILQYFIYLPLIPLLWYQFLKVDLALLVKQLPFFLLFSIGFVLLYYSNEDAQSPFPFESIVLGEIHVDTLFHASIANMFERYGIPSTGLNGVPYLHYHWGSHLLFVGFKNLLQIHILGFYGYVFPIVFIPLLLKVVYEFLGQLRIRIFYFAESFNSFYYFLAILGVFISMGLFLPFWTIGESNTLAVIFALNLLVFLLGNQELKSWFNLRLLAIVFISLCMMVFAKISVGLPLAATLLFLVIRHAPSRNFKVASALIFVLLVVIMVKATMIRSQGGFIEIITSDLKVFAANLLKSNALFWRFSNGIFHYGIGLLIFLMYRIYASKFETREKSTLRWLFFEGLAFLNLISLALGFYATGVYGSMEAWYFSYLQLMIAVITGLAFIEKGISKFIKSSWIYPIGMLLIVISFISTKGFYSISSGEYRDVSFYKEFSRRYNQRDTTYHLMHQFVEKGINYKASKNELFYIDTAQTWIYGSQKFRPHSQAFLVQSVFAGATVAGLSPETYMGSKLAYTFKDYRRNTTNPFPNLNQAISFAKELNFINLIEIKSSADSVNIIKHQLN